MSPETITKRISFGKLGISVIVPVFNQQRKIFHRNIDKNDQYDQDLTCMVEGCVAIGEEVIALLDEASLSDVDEYDDDDEHHASQGNNFKNKKEEDYDLIPVIVCGKHFDMLIEAYYGQQRSKGVEE
jgi:hypothetical protein